MRFFFLSILIYLSAKSYAQDYELKMYFDNITTEPFITQANIKVGQQFSILAWGKVSRGCNPESFTATPEGNSCGNKNDFLYPQFHCWSLIVQIGKGKPFEYNTSDWQTAQDSGEVTLTMNYDKSILEKAVNSSCSGIANGWNIQIQIDDDECKFDDYPQVGDVVIYWGKEDNGLRHSGYVSQVDGCRVTGINCWLQGEDKVLNNINPDDPVLSRFGIWTVYTTNRPNGRFIEMISDKVWNSNTKEFQISTEGLTDSKREITIYHAYNYLGNDIGKDFHNCHGFTFGLLHDGDEPWGLNGYVTIDNGNKIVHAKGIADQVMAVKIILHDNGYKQVHALGLQGKKDHYNPLYNISAFK